MKLHPIKNSIVGFSTLLLLSIPSCENMPWDCLEGNDRIVTERRPVSDFLEISSYGDYLVYIEPASTFKVELEGDENILPFINTSVRGNKLVIETRNGRCIRTHEPIKIYIQSPGIREVKLYGSGAIYYDNFVRNDFYAEILGSGNIECFDINVDFFKGIISGSGTIEASGYARNSDFLLTGSGMIKTLDMEQKNCVANISGSGNIFAFVTDELDVLISGSGNFYYAGTPDIQQTITGTGRVRAY